MPTHPTPNPFEERNYKYPLTLSPSAIRTTALPYALSKAFLVTVFFTSVCKEETFSEQHKPNFLLLARALLRWGQ